MSLVHRTADGRFADLAGYAFAPNYIEDLPGFAGLRAHYLDEGPVDANDIFLCLHGEPTWAYLYRRMIPEFVNANGRVVVPDMFGFGRSDKPADEATYTFDFHRRYLLEFIDHLNLKNITLVCQDWGGLLGLTLPMDLPGRFIRLIVMNTMLGTGDEPLSKGFLAWRQWVRDNPDMAVGRLLKRACAHLNDQEAAAYDAPFPDSRFLAGVRRFPELVPDNPEADGAEVSRHARDWWRNEWRGQAFMAIGMADPVLGGPVMHGLREDIRDCPPPLEMADGGHFLQEWGVDVARAALAAFARG
ncbi:MAG: haloalkane dehalogenase [Alphaproteobacteria bacterium]|nr:haloalkane dehalogenase [Alphaproteobacteria bacterium]|tara:strand:- start:91 stop:993 length:903 start_codon:yes stop_codon:yes gene_type:complete